MSWTSTGLNLSEQWFISQGGVDSWWALKSRVKIAVSFYWTCMSLWKVPFGFINKVERLGSVWFPTSCWMKVPGFSYSSMWIFLLLVPLLQVQSSLMWDVPVTCGKREGVFLFYLSIILECWRASDYLVWEPTIGIWSSQPSVTTLVVFMATNTPHSSFSQVLKKFPLELQLNLARWWHQAMGLGQGLLEVRTAKLELVKDGVLKTWAGTVHRGEGVLKSGASSAVILIISNRKSASVSCVERASWQEDLLMLLSLLFH